MQHYIRTEADRIYAYHNENYDAALGGAWSDILHTHVDAYQVLSRYTNASSDVKIPTRGWNLCRNRNYAISASQTDNVKKYTPAPQDGSCKRGNACRVDHI